MKRKNLLSDIIRRGFKLLFLAFLVFISLFPVYWTTVNSFRTNTQIFSQFRLIPEQFVLDAYVQILRSKTILSGLMNSTIITAAVILASTAIVLMASYVLALYHFKLGTFIYLAFVAAMFIPAGTTMGTVYKLVNDFHLLGTRTGIIVVYTSGRLALSIFLMTSFMRIIPLAIQEAAIIDGCNPLSLFTHIVIPLSQNGIVVVVVLTFINIWNEYIMAMLMLPSRSVRTLTVALASYIKSEYSTDYAFLSAGVVVGLLPILIVYLVLQERIINGLVASAVKG